MKEPNKPPRKNNLDNKKQIKVSPYTEDWLNETAEYCDFDSASEMLDALSGADRLAFKEFMEQNFLTE